MEVRLMYIILDTAITTIIWFLSLYQTRYHNHQYYNIIVLSAFVISGDAGLISSTEVRQHFVRLDECGLSSSRKEAASLTSQKGKSIIIVHT